MGELIHCSVCNVTVRADREAAHMEKVHPTVASTLPKGASGAKAPKRPLYVSRGAKKALFTVVLVVVIILAGVMLFQSAERGTPIDPSATVVRVSMSGFDPGTIVGKVGTPLRINLVNMDNSYHTDGGGWHNFAIDDFSMNMTVEPLGQRVFTVPTETAGTYGWYCSMCCGGRGNPSMNGRLVVQP